MQNKDLKYTISGNTISVYNSDLKIGSIENKQKDKGFICVCMVPENLIDELIDWHESCDYANDDFLSFNLLQIPEEVSYDPPAIQWTSHKDLETSITDLYECWNTMQQSS
ncbi:hypothetical protein [Powai lake megavirus]|uniref:Uncharacterized protein n=1 Tax=Powai lake megavirus TaxID=1842663 RepID=A0A167R148_9VIRU|nr:hypothetical protein QJ849_gp027 [Powai lake megavirus]ANB50189.1 hypothetical protein [Powai lake megavirus]